MIKNSAHFRGWLGASLLSLAMAAPVFGADWYRWRGPEQTGVSRETNLVDSWDPDTGKNVIWRNDVGGMSSPIVMNGRVYAWSRAGEVKVNNTTVVGPQTQAALVCVDAATGKRIWEYRVNMTETDVPFHRVGWGNIAGDPKSNHVYGYSDQGCLVCLDATDGKLIWKRQMTEEFGVISTFGGRTQSPAVDEDQVLLTGIAFGWGDNARAVHRIFAFDKNTGRLNWSTGVGGIPVDAPYGTPVIAVVNGERIVCTLAGDGGCYGVKARTGEQVFSYQLSRRGTNVSALVVGNYLIASSAEENVSSATLGAVACIDISQVDAQGRAKQVWRHEGIEAGFASPTTDGTTAFILDNKATIHAIDIATGKQLWKQGTGTIGKPSLVYADGKLYCSEANGRFVVVKPPAPGQKRAKVISKIELSADAQQLGREYYIFGSPAISNGRFYLQTAAGTYCFGAAQPVDTISAGNPIPQLPREAPASADAVPTFVQVVPADVVARPGETIQFTVRTFDSMGHMLKDNVPAAFSIGPVSIPPAPRSPAGTPAVKVGNLRGSVTADGNYTAESGPPQGGAIVATVKVGDHALSGFARVRVVPNPPEKIDFETALAGKPPLTWIGAGGKFEVRQLPDHNKVLVKTLNFDLYHAARTYFGDARQSDYTIEADILCGSKQAGTQTYIPDAGVINTKYSLTLLGNHQQCMLISWQGALPKEGQLGVTLYKAVPFKWSGDTWYHFKLTVSHDDGKAHIRGKVWKKGDKEPADWTIELVDNIPNTEGSPGLYGESLVTPYKSEIYYDNVVVTENK